MDSGRFDRVRFDRHLAARRLGRRLVTRAETGSTNDDAWEAATGGATEGTVIIADHQTRGRGRSGRVWHDAPGRGLALSVLLDPGRDVAAATTAPLVAGLALARGLQSLGPRADLRWPNDLLLGGRKLAGILCESRGGPGGPSAVVVGVGVNVSQRAEDFPAELRESATSLALEGHDLAREDVAAAFLDALEPLWDEHRAGRRAAALEAWRAWARDWGRPVRVRTPSGEVSGTALRLDELGALIVRTADGGEVRIVAGDVAVSATPERA